MYEEQEAAMIGYNCHVFDRSALRGQPQTLVINSLVFTSHTAADVTSDDNIFCVFSSNVMISSVDTNLTGHLTTKATSVVVIWLISGIQVVFST